MRRSLLNQFEYTIRKSWLSKSLPLIRQNFPQLHRMIVSVRDKVIPLHSSQDLSRYQYRSIQRFMTFIESHQNALDAILEIGSDRNRSVLKTLKDCGAKVAIGINPSHEVPLSKIESSSINEGINFARSDGRSLPFPAETFTSIFSVATFEHINDINKAFDEFHRVLKVGGILFSEFGPIWSCSVGHHVFAKVDGEEARHWKPGKNPVPNYSHLLLSQDEMRGILKQKVSERLTDAIVKWIYESEDINRLFYEDYVRVFQESQFEIISLTPITEYVNRKILMRLQHKYPGYKEFGCRIIEVILRKTSGKDFK
jgi:ubiquinone/menaquinone biosynthesis C-methylase UbiE